MQLRSSRRARAAVGVVAAFALLLTGCSGGDAVTYSPPKQADAKLPDATVEELNAAVTRAMQASGASGAVVGVWVPWSGTWVAGVGTQGGGDETKISTDMSFRVGNVTRLMTCDVLYGLADEGVLKLDDPVPSYVSGVPDLKNVTLLDLCNGTAGIGSSEAAVAGLWTKTPAREWQPLQLASYGLAQARTEPGGEFRESDAGYLMLGLALERAAGMSAAELIEKYVTEPLGLGSTSLPDPAAAAPSPSPPMKGWYAPAIEGGLNCQAPVDITELSSSVGFTDSGVVSNITDLGRYVQADARQALRAEDAKPGRFDSPLPAGPKAPSWYQATGGAYLIGTMVGQHGWVPGYATAAYSDPATGFTVAVALNSSNTGGNIAAYLSWELAAIASKAPAAKGETAPEFGLPFTAEQYRQAIADAAVTCVAPPAAG